MGRERLHGRIPDILRDHFIGTLGHVFRISEANKHIARTIRDDSEINVGAYEPNCGGHAGKLPATHSSGATNVSLRRAGSTYRQAFGLNPDTRLAGRAWLD